MNRFLTNLLLAAVWAGARGEPTGASFALGFLLGYLVLLLLEPTRGESSYHIRAWYLIKFVVFYIWDFVTASLRVTHDVLTPRFRMKPGVIRVPLAARTDLEITLFANLLSLTPGTLALDVSRDRGHLYVHAMFIAGGDADRLRQEIKDNLERRVLRLVRGPEPRARQAAEQAPERGNG